MRTSTLLLTLSALLSLSALGCGGSANAEPVKTGSTMTGTSRSAIVASIGKPAPNFKLTGADAKSYDLSQFKGKYVVLEWVNYDCPFVVAQYGAGRMPKLQKTMTDAGVVWLSINTGAEGKQGVFAGQTLLDRIAKEKAVPTAYLRDADGAVGKLYGAKTTPHIYLISPEQVLLFAGALDDTPTTDKADVKMEGSYIEAAYNEAKAGKPITNPNPKSYGCGVKYG